MPFENPGKYLAILKYAANTNLQRHPLDFRANIPRVSFSSQKEIEFF